MTVNFNQLRHTCIFILAFLGLTQITHAQDPCLIRTGVEPAIQQNTFRAVDVANADLIGLIPWMNPAFASGADDSLATVSLAPGERSDRLIFSNFFFDIPLGARIAGIQLEITGASSNFDELDERQIQFLLGGNPLGNNLADKSILANIWPDSLDSWNYGFEFSDWGIDPTFQLLNSNELEFAIQIELSLIHI